LIEKFFNGGRVWLNNDIMGTLGHFHKRLFFFRPMFS